MKAVIAGISALDFYRKVYPADRAPDPPGLLHNIDFSYAYRDDDVWSLLPSWVTPDFTALENGRVHLLTNSASLRASSKSITSHVWTSPLPEGSCYPYSDSVLIASPCFAFLQMAQELDSLELIALGDELCGLYSFDEKSERGMRQRKIPLVTSDQLRQFVESNPTIYGQKKALAALEYVVDRSASPMETSDEMLLCLPPRLGGYSEEIPKMNHPIPLSGRAAFLVDTNPCYGDMCWPRVKLDVEHYGDFDHSSKQARLNDRARINAIKEMGYEVIELTGDQVANLKAFETLALTIAKKTGKRIRAQHLGPTEQRIHLRKTLFAWNRAFGRHR